MVENLSANIMRHKKATTPSDPGIRMRFARVKMTLP
jgi:hypothetical protein